MKGIRSLAVTALVTLLAAPVAAQDILVGTSPSGAIFRGMVVDSLTGNPIEGVMIRMDSGEEALSDGAGEFQFLNLPQGRRLYAIMSSDCRITWGQIDVIVGIPRERRMRLPPAFGAAAEEAQREEERRRKAGGGRVLEMEEIDRMNARSAADLLQRVAPNMVQTATGDPGATAGIVSGRTRSFVTIGTEGRSTNTASSLRPVIVIDGIRVPDGERALHDLQASDVARLEVLPGAAAGWEFGSSGAGGVIKVTLRRGLATGAAIRREAAPCIVPEFPTG